MASIERPAGVFVTVKGKWAAALGLVLVFAGAATPVRATGSGHTSVGADSATYSQVSAGNGTSCAISTNLHVVCWGDNVFNENRGSVRQIHSDKRRLANRLRYPAVGLTCMLGRQPQ